MEKIILYLVLYGLYQAFVYYMKQKAKKNTQIPPQEAKKQQDNPETFTFEGWLEKELQNQTTKQKADSKPNKGIEPIEPKRKKQNALENKNTIDKTSNNHAPLKQKRNFEAVAMQKVPDETAIFWQSSDEEAKIVQEEPAFTENQLPLDHQSLRTAFIYQTILERKF